MDDLDSPAVPLQSEQSGDVVPSTLPTDPLANTEKKDLTSLQLQVTI